MKGNSINIPQTIYYIFKVFIFTFYSHLIESLIYFKINLKIILNYIFEIAIFAGYVTF